MKKNLDFLRSTGITELTLTPGIYRLQSNIFLILSLNDLKAIQ